MKRPVCMTSNLHCALFEPGSLDFWVANADSQSPAAHTRFTHYNLAEILQPEKAAVSLSRRPECRRRNASVPATKKSAKYLLITRAISGKTHRGALVLNQSNIRLTMKTTNTSSSRLLCSLSLWRAGLAAAVALSLVGAATLQAQTISDNFNDQTDSGAQGTWTTTTWVTGPLTYQAEPYLTGRQPTRFRPIPPDRLGITPIKYRRRRPKWAGPIPWA